MRGLIYKDFMIFCKCVDKKLLFLAIGCTAVVLYSCGIYGGVVASVILAMVIGTQNVTSLGNDDKACWKKYQMAMPVSDFFVVASKYISVLYTLGISISISLVINLVSSLVFRSFDPAVWGMALFASVFIPLLWTAVCLPFTYWFGVQSAQAMGLLMIVPEVYLIRYFEDGPGLSHMAGALSSYFLLAGLAALVLFGISLAVSAAGYGRRK